MKNENKWELMEMMGKARTGILKLFEESVPGGYDVSIWRDGGMQRVIEVTITLRDEEEFNTLALGHFVKVTDLRMWIKSEGYKIRMEYKMFYVGDAGRIAQLLSGDDEFMILVPGMLEGMKAIEYIYEEVKKCLKKS